METKFNCSIPVFIPTANLLWSNCEANIVAMGNFKSKFTPSYVTSKKAALIAAQNMPDADARAAVHEAIRVQVTNDSKACMRIWQNLKSYCRDAYSYNKDVLDTKLTEAGWNYYDNAAQNVPACEAMMVSAINFITENEAVLISNGYMPIDFKDRVVEISATLTSTYNSYLVSVEAARAGTVERNTALNNCYSDVISMCLDGQDLFADNEMIKPEFVFDTVMSIVAPAGAAAAAVTVLNAETNTPMTAEVMVQGGSESVTTNASTGKCEITQLASGATQFTITANGFAPQTITHQLSPGTTSRITVLMAPLFITPQTNTPVPENGMTPANISEPANTPSLMGSQQPAVSNGQAVVNS